MEKVGARTDQRELAWTSGWYHDPWQQGCWRYWDGERWTGHTHRPDLREEGSSGETFAKRAGSWDTPEGKLIGGISLAVLALCLLALVPDIGAVVAGGLVIYGIGWLVSGGWSGNSQPAAVAHATVVQTPAREAIPRAVRHEVWRRDLGRCAQCGSRERLEFDHMVPVSKGGSNTARNIELLCERCNRRKGAAV